MGHIKVKLPFHFQCVVLLLHQCKVDGPNLRHAASARLSACLQRLRDNEHPFRVLPFAAEHGQEAVSERAIHDQIQHRVDAAHNNLAIFPLIVAILGHTEPTLIMETMSRVDGRK